MTSLAVAFIVTTRVKFTRLSSGTENVKLATFCPAGTSTEAGTLIWPVGEVESASVSALVGANDSRMYPVCGPLPSITRAGISNMARKSSSAVTTTSSMAMPSSGAEALSYSEKRMRKSGPNVRPL